MGSLDPFFWVPFATSLSVLFVCERIAHVLIAILSSAESKEGIEARQLVSAFVTFAGSVVFGIFATSRATELLLFTAVTLLFLRT